MVMKCFARKRRFRDFFLCWSYLIPVLNYPSDLLSSAYIIGEGIVTPLQYSFLENPMDGGAW